MTYRISTVSDMTGVPRNTLIAWERRYGFVRPKRHENGYRSYNGEDVSRILRVKNALAAGLKISEAVQLLHQADKEKKRPGSSLSTAGAPFEGTDEAFATVRDQFVSALIAYRREEADRILLQLIPVPFSTRLTEVYFPVLRIIGQKWATGEISVAQEHYASAIIRSNLAALLISATPTAGAARIACTTFPGEQHEIAALALAVQCSLEGQRVTYLGANMPADDLVDFVRAQSPDLLCVSCIQSPSDEELESYATALSQGAPPMTRIVLGGAGMTARKLERSRIEIIPRWEDLVV